MITHTPLEWMTYFSDIRFGRQNQVSNGNYDADRNADG